MKPKFCHSCGKKLIPHNPPRFDGETGEKINDTCPSGLCQHRNVACIPSGIWWPKCIKCGDRMYD